MTDTKSQDAKKHLGELVSQAAANPKNVQLQAKMAKCLWTSSCGNSSSEFDSVRGPGIIALVKALDLHKNNIELNTSAFAVLCNMASREEDRTTLKSHTRLMPAIAQSVLAHSENKDVVLHAFSAVSNLTLNISQPEIKPIAESGIVQATLQALQSRKHEPEILQAAMQSLSNIATCHELTSLINKNGGLGAIVSTMSKHPNNQMLQKYGCALLLRLAVFDPANKDAFRELNAIGSIVYFLRTNGADAHKAALAIHTLYVVAYGNNFNKNVMRTLRAWNEVVTAMSLHKDSVSVQKNACQALWIASVSNDANKDYVREIKGIEAIVHAMTVHRKEAAVQQYACGALASLARVAMNQAVIPEHKGLVAIIVALKTHVNDMGVQKNGFAAIWTLARHRQLLICNTIKSLRGIDAILAGMDAHAQHSEVQYMGVGALSAVCIREGNTVDVTTEQSVIRVCIAAMCKFKSHVELQKSACSTLTALASDSNRDFLVSSAVVETLIVIKHKHMSVQALQRQCEALLAILAPKT
jgi:hypothetical protein